MTISKKLVTMAVFALGIQTIAQGYDVVGLKDEVALILNRTEENRMWDHNYEIASWIQDKIDRTYMTSNSEIIAIAHIFNNKECLSQKIDTFATIIKAEKQKRKYKSDLILTVLGAVYLVGIGLTMYDGVISAIAVHDSHFKIDILNTVQKVIDQKISSPDALL